MKRSHPAIPVLLNLSIEYGNRHFGTKLHEINVLEAELANWLFNDRNGVWQLLSDGLITEREARDLLLQKIFDYYRLTLSRLTIKDPTDDPVENESFDLALFGHTASDRPPR
jgi:hypothetical protein